MLSFITQIHSISVQSDYKGVYQVSQTLVTTLLEEKTDGAGDIYN